MGKKREAQAEAGRDRGEAAGSRMRYLAIGTF